MTREQQNNTIILKLGEKLRDLPNVQDVIGKSFRDWFRKLAEAGAEQQKPVIEETPQMMTEAKAE